MSKEKERRETPSVGRRIVGRLRQFAEALEKNDAIPERFTRRTIKLNLDPTPFNARRVKEARKALSASQAIFAQFLGVSVAAVRDWEQGAKSPRGIACRMVDEILRDPKYWRNRLEELATPVGGK